MLAQNIRLVFIARGGIYAYCYRNGYNFLSNKNEKVVKFRDNLEFDIFV